MKLYVAGSDGFVGSAICTGSRHKTDIVGLSPISTPGSGRLDLLDLGQFDFGSLEPGSTVVFTAAISSPDKCSEAPEETAKINVQGTSLFIENALGRGCRVIFFSSDVVFGHADTPPEEESPLCPFGIYGQQKAEVEGRFRGEAEFKVVRPSYIVSIKDKFTSYLLNAAALGRKAEVFHPFLRSAIHLDDVIETIDRLHEAWGAFRSPSINLCGPRLVSRADLAAMVKKVVAPDLAFDAIPLSDAFLKSRPARIHMKSNQIETILGRPPLDIEAALAAELRRV
ncbi:NAD-dependent epimerase/dehydratase family protein [Mesoterricola sediminis]|uniref:Capsular polysaccharide biosynthesis protein n=1 Tax=Mesoterricola sediminis TaxID=2927980 RepID=A0AA48GPP7_9BACT|nr:NAD(P)-dependent oxidoreductase [Mesoterricola sediminis]BDU75297.1 capsular polysaccharide biosynthesis protein [Mesoterricola sediminis]